MLDRDVNVSFFYRFDPDERWWWRRSIRVGWSSSNTRRLAADLFIGSPVVFHSRLPRQGPWAA